ncbi:hypothetical protein FPOAC1_010449 [Fusarium poae]|uniref:hypothetical protein n=1 Tax=Fusarium poae TaxID=36050 RepID=UPI001CE8E105|nr:hypothetical protein FPOAC1_010449 [Fusarium poae]KAG8665650.1 hypothetical protein FPOAC1_010449 [Fusarium poae]
MLDEANRMTESISAIPMSKCPKAYFLIVDDIRQFSPVITTMHRDDWKSFFGPQRQTSLFKRMEYSGAIQQRLESNYRARLDAADFIREKFYGGQMTIVNSMPLLRPTLSRITLLTKLGHTIQMSLLTFLSSLKFESVPVSQILQLLSLLSV